MNTELTFADETFKIRGACYEVYPKIQIERIVAERGRFEPSVSVEQEKSRTA